MNGRWRRISIRFCSIIILVFSFANTIDAQKKWDGGGGDSLWENPLNWSDNSIPLSSDDILLDNSFAAGNYEVIISGSGGTANCRSILISPDAANHIRLIIPASNRQSIALSTFAPVYSIELNAGAELINASGASSGTILNISDSMRINNNGRYIHRTPRGNAAILNKLSSAPGTERGIIEFDVPVVSGSYIVSLTNRTFGSIVFSAVTHAAPLTYTSNGNSAVNIRGDLQINAQVSLSVGFNDTITVKGDFSHEGNLFNLSNNGNATVLRLEGNVSTGTTSTITETNVAQPVILLSGSAMQDLHMQGSIINEIILKVRKNGNVLVSYPFTLPYILELRKGIVKTDRTNLLTLGTVAEIIVDSTFVDSSFIDGPMRKIGFVARDHFLFPVGKENKMRWVELKSITGDFMVEFFKGNPYSLGSSLSGIDHLSKIEYWAIESPAPASAKVELSFDNVNSGGVTDLASLRVAQLSGAWINQGNSGTSGTAGSSGSVTSILLNSFNTLESHFTLASIMSNENPLPEKWINLSARAFDGKVELKWTVPQNLKLIAFIAEISYDGFHFNRIGELNVDPNHETYVMVLNRAGNKPMVFRITAIEVNGQTIQSNLEGVSMQIDKVSISSNGVIASNQLNIWVSSQTDEVLNIIIVSNYGQEVFKKKIHVEKGIHRIELVLPVMGVGSYYLFGMGGEFRTNVVHLIKIK